MSIEKILIIDDEEMQRALLGSMLRMKFPGASLIFASTGSEARVALEKGFFDIVLCDVQVGNDNGFAIYDNFRSRNPSPFVMHSGNPCYEENAKERGLVFLSKPFRRQELYDVINNAVSGRG